MPLAGVFPFSSSVDTVGFFTTSVDDLSTVCAAYFDEPELPAPSQPIRVGVVRDLFCEPPDDDMGAAVDDAGERLQAAGFGVSECELPAVLREAYDNHQTLIAAEAALAHAELFANHESEYSPKLSELVRRGQQVSPAELEACRGRRAELQSELDAVWGTVDVLLLPSAPGAALKGLESTGDPRMSLLSSHTRVPALTLPVRLNGDGLPLGIQLVAKHNSDMQLLAAGRQIESILGFDACPPEA